MKNVRVDLRGTASWVLIALGAVGAAWQWSIKLRREPPAPAHASTPTSIEGPSPAAEAPEAQLERARSAWLASQYVRGDSGEAELEEFWRQCGPVLPDELEALYASLEHRVAMFERMCVSMPRSSRTLPPSEGHWTTDDFFAEYGEVGLAEARYLLEECAAGRMRRTPFFPAPESVLDSTHPSAQLIPHAMGLGGYVARIEKSEQAELFEARPRIYALAQEVVARAVPEDVDVINASSSTRRN
jgi:hypothetical protein